MDNSVSGNASLQDEFIVPPFHDKLLVVWWIPANACDKPPGPITMLCFKFFSLSHCLLSYV